MKIILTPDSLKGSLSARDACRAMEKGCRRVFPHSTIIHLPGGDGGEGTLEALQFAWGENARRISCPVSGLQGERIAAPLLLQGKKAAIESATCAGLPPPGAEKNILTADSQGVGQLILSALDLGAQEILITLGGTGCSDGGLHLLRALGMQALDQNGAPVPRGIEGLEQLHSVNFSTLDERLADVKLTVLTDVSNPLLGRTGATYVYAPQKGADEALLPRLEKAMTRYADILEQALGRSIRHLPGAGAAGGMGAALLGVLGAVRKSGADAVLDEMQFELQCRDANLVLTSEGLMDGQSVAFGKYPARAALRALAMQVPVIALVGGRTKDADAFLQLGQTALFAITDKPMTLENAVAQAEELMAQASENALRCVQMGMQMKG